MRQKPPAIRAAQQVRVLFLRQHQVFVHEFHQPFE
jgi:hypothetical protein